MVSKWGTQDVDPEGEYRSYILIFVLICCLGSLNM
jgi:hypothetical protein